MTRHAVPLTAVLLALLPSGGRAQIRFTDVSVAAGVGGDVYDSTTRHSLGINWLDFNDDNWPDLFLVNGQGLSAHLYENNRDGTFTNRDSFLPPLPNVDMTRSLFADYDNDGDVDIYVLTDNNTLTFTDPNVPDGPYNFLLRNQWVETGVVAGQPLFEEVGAAAGVQDAASPPLGPLPGMRAKTGVFLDYDRDGDQDIYLGHMVALSGGQRSNIDRFYRNEGDGTFRDVTVASGVNAMVDSTTWRPALASLGAHLDGDLWPDIYVANVADPLPFHQDQIFRNNGDGTFSEIAGTMTGIGDDSEAAMGIDTADIDHDGDWDVYISDLLNTSLDALPLGNVLYLNNGDGTFADNSAPGAGVAADNSWGVSFFDADHDTYEDLLVVTMKPITTGPFLFENNGDGTFTDVSSSDGLACGDGRGSATADYDRDGDLDVAIVNSVGGPLQLFRNDTPAAGNSFALKLRGASSSTDAIGCLVELEVGGDTLLRQVKGGSSAHSEDDLAVHFGLGAATTVDVVRIFWPSGVVDSLTGQPANAFVTVVEGTTASPRPVVRASPLHLDFGPVGVGSTADRTVTLFNDGNQDLTVNSLGVSTPVFALPGPPATPFTVAPGGTQDVVVRFAPATAVPEAGTLDVSTDDPGNALQSVGLAGQGADVVGAPEAAPAHHALWSRAEPNPFRPRTTIRYATPAAGHVRLEVYDAAGRRVITLVDGLRRAGPHAAEWDGGTRGGGPAPSGVYFYRLSLDGRGHTRKILRLR